MIYMKPLVPLWNQRLFLHFSAKIKTYNYQIIKRNPFSDRHIYRGLYIRYEDNAMRRKDGCL